jgi:glutamyl/glutaminyl-tRNA synthetase
VLELFRGQGILIPEKDLARDTTADTTAETTADTTGNNDFPLMAPSSPDGSGEPMPNLFAAAAAEAAASAAAAAAAGPDPRTPAPNRFEKILDTVKDRCHLLPDFVQQASFFFQPPTTIDTPSIQPKWNDAKQQFFAELIRQFQTQPQWDAASLESQFKEMAAAAAIKPGDLLAPFRIMLVGGKFGPPVFDIAASLGKEETLQRIRHTLGLLHG